MESGRRRPSPSQLPASRSRSRPRPGPALSPTLPPAAPPGLRVQPRLVQSRPSVRHGHHHRRFASERREGQKVMTDCDDTNGDPPSAWHNSLDQIRHMMGVPLDDDFPDIPTPTYRPTLPATDAAHE